MPTWPIAAGSLALGFAVAVVTDVRALGGVMLLLAVAWCFARWRSRVGLGRACGLVALYLVLFAVSHVLGRGIGAWPAVAVVSVVMGALAWAIADAGGPQVSSEPRNAASVAASSSGASSAM